MSDFQAEIPSAARFLNYECENHFVRIRTVWGFFKHLYYPIFFKACPKIQPDKKIQFKATLLDRMSHNQLPHGHYLTCFGDNLVRLQNTRHRLIGR